MKKILVLFTIVFALVACTAAVVTLSPQSAIAEGCSGSNC